MVGLQLFVKFTPGQGKAMRAVSEDKEAAVLMGINVNSTIALTFRHRLRSGRGRLADVLRRLPAGSRYDGRHAGPEAFVATVLGGMVPIPGAMIVVGPSV